MSVSKRRLSVVALTLLVAAGLIYAFVVHNRREIAAPPGALVQEPKTTDLFGDPLPPGAISRIGTIRLRSSRDIDRVALSPDGKILVTDAGHVSLKVWDAATGLPLRTIETVEYEGELRGFRKSRETVAMMAFAADSRRLHVLTHNGILRACDVTDGKWSEPLARTAGPVPREHSLDLSGGWASPDGTHFAYAPRTEPYRVEVFAVGKERPIITLTDKLFGEWGRGSRFSDDNQLIAVRVDEEFVKVWDVTTGREVKTYKVPDADLRTFALSPDKQSLAAVFAPKGDRRFDDPLTLVIWDSVTGQERLRVPDWKGYIAGYSHDGKKLISLHRNEVLIADATTGQVTRRMKGHGTADYLTFAITTDRKKLITGGGRDHSVIIWDLETEKPALDFDGLRGTVLTLAFSPNGETVFASTSQEQGSLWNARTGQRKHRFDTDRYEMALSAAFTPDKRHVVAGYGNWNGSSSDGDWPVRLWSVADGKLVREFRGHKDMVRHLAVSTDGKQLVTRDRSARKVRLWELDTGKLTREIPWIDDYAAKFTYPTADELIGIGSGQNGKREMIELLSGKVIGNWKKEDRAYVDALSPDGHLVVSREHKGANGEQFVLRRTSTGEAVCELPLTHVTHVSPVAFSGDSKTVAVSKGFPGVEGEIAVHVFETATGKELCQFRGHTGAISSIAFSPDGKRLATGSWDSTVLVWDLSAK